MTKHRERLRIAVAFVIALLAGVLLGTLVQTQINLLALQALGVDISFTARLVTTGDDLVNFAPIYLIVFGASFLASQLVAMVGTRFVLKDWRRLVCAVAAAVGLWATLKLVDSQAPMPTLIAATRDGGGMLTILVSAAIAGWIFAVLAANVRSAGHGPRLDVLALMIMAGALPEPSTAQTGSAYQVDTVVDGLEHPWSVAFLPDGRMLITERPGRLRVVSEAGRLVAEPVEGLPDVFVSGQAGLFEVSLAPGFADSQELYLSYACGDVAANHTCLARAEFGDGRLENVTEVFRTQPAKQGAAHYGGRIAWLPDETLVLGLGDGFDYREEAQQLSSHIASTVRLNPDGSTPDDNPFVNEPDARPEIYSYGHRNIQGLAYDPADNRLVAHEHGPRGGDEINIIKPGINYGWPIATHGLDYTGARVSPFTEYQGTEPPLLHWTPSIAPSGMTLYRGELFPEWEGDLLVGALASRQVHRVTLKNGQAEDAEVLFEELDERMRDVRTGPEGAVYLLTDAPEGRLLRITPRQ